MSRKIKSTRMKRKGNHTKKKIKGGADGLSHPRSKNLANLQANAPDNKRREYTVILLENSDTDTKNDPKDIITIKKKIQEKMEEKLGEMNKKLDVIGDDELSKELEYEATKLPEFQVNGLKIIESGLHVGEESINNSSITGRFARQSNTSHKKYLGIILDLTHFAEKTSLDGSEIIKIFRDVILFPEILIQNV